MIITEQHPTPFGNCVGGIVPTELVPEAAFQITGTCPLCRQWVACKVVGAPLVDPLSRPRRRAQGSR